LAKLKHLAKAFSIKELTPTGRLFFFHNWHPVHENAHSGGQNPKNNILSMKKAILVDRRYKIRVLSSKTPLFVDRIS
jgi:hypothetical protein